MRPKLIVQYAVEPGSDPTASAGGAVFQDGIDNGFIADPNIGYKGTEDNYVSAYGSSRAINMGQSDYITAGAPNYSATQKGILKWDLSALNTLAGGEYLRVDYARVDIGSRGCGYEDQDVDVVAIAPANAGWAECAGNEGYTGEPYARPGDSDWLFKEVTVGGPQGTQNGIPWAGSVGLSTVNTDYDPTVIATLHKTDNLSTNYQQFAFKVPNPVVQSWIDDPGDNAGLMFKTPQIPSLGMVNFISSEYAYPMYLVYSMRPKLSIVYTVGGDPLTEECESLPGDISGAGGDPDCYLDMYDYAKFASEWAEDETQ